jgi:very-short-patch-repair endonuclease
MENLLLYQEQLRESPTLFELRFKARLEAAGVVFVFQEIIAPYIPDFVIREKKIIIELDGRHHRNDADKVEYDKRRDKYLQNRGWTVIRIANKDASKFNIAQLGEARITNHKTRTRTRTGKKQKKQKERIVCGKCGRRLKAKVDVNAYRETWYMPVHRVLVGGAWCNASRSDICFRDNNKPQKKAAPKLAQNIIDGKTKSSDINFKPSKQGKMQLADMPTLPANYSSNGIGRSYSRRRG